MLTGDNRPRRLIQIAIECFKKQTYQNRELVIVDDRLGDASGYDITFFKAWCIRVSGGAIPMGAKWNIACQAAKGDILTFWEDDDWHHPQRLERQLAVLRKSQAGVVGLERVRYYDLQTGQRWIYHHPGHTLDGTLMFRRTFYELGNFPRAIARAAALWMTGKPAPLCMPDEDLYLGIVHGKNVWAGHSYGDVPWHKADDFEIPGEVEACRGNL